jgi:hypothetical protein
MNIERTKLAKISEIIARMRRTGPEDIYHTEPDIVVMNPSGNIISVGNQTFIAAEIRLYIKELNEDELFSLFHPFTILMAIGEKKFLEKYGNKYDTLLANYKVVEERVPIKGYPQFNKPLLRPVNITKEQNERHHSL